jgi:hypothetical protein
MSQQRIRLFQSMLQSQLLEDSLLMSRPLKERLLNRSLKL